MVFGKHVDRWVRRIPGWAIWPIAFIIICSDYEDLDLFDCTLLVVLAVLTSWAAFTRNKWIQLSVASLLLATTFFAMASLGASPRALIWNERGKESSFVDGVRAYDQVFRLCRPYIRLASSGLFVIAVSATSNREKIGKTESRADCSS